jgi:predicted nucleic acid-binding protein
VKIVFDSSSFAKRFIAEAGSAEVDAVCQQASELGLSVLCVPEIISALTRRVREGSLPQSGYQQAKTQLLAEIRDIEVINLSPEVVATAVTLLENNKLRAMDALHIACALHWNADLFVSSDHRQIQAAQNSGLAVRFI